MQDGLPSPVVTTADGINPLSKRTRAGSVKIFVTDTGVGLTSAQLSKIFGEGVQFDASKLQSGKGSGLGLFISKNIVERHGGRLTVQSDGIGSGCTFTMELPLVLESVESDDKIAKTSSTGVQETASSREVLFVVSESATSDSVHATKATAEQRGRVLLVDDSIPTRKLLRRLLEAKGFVCDEADDGIDAIEKYQMAMGLKSSVVGDACLTNGLIDIETGIKSEISKGYDLIVLDYEMPRMTGPETARKLRELGCECVIVGATGNSLPGDLALFYECGADEVLSKPILIENLLLCWNKKSGKNVRNE